MGTTPQTIHTLWTTPQTIHNLSTPFPQPIHTPKPPLTCDDDPKQPAVHNPYYYDYT